MKWILNCLLFIVLFNLSLGAIDSTVEYLPYPLKIPYVDYLVYGVRNQFVVNSVVERDNQTTNQYVITTQIGRRYTEAKHSLEVKAYPLKGLISAAELGQSSHVSATDQKIDNIWGVAVDEPNGIIYTLEKEPGSAGYATMGEINVYNINSQGKFNELTTIDNFYNKVTLRNLGVFGVTLTPQYNITVPIIPMIYFKGHLFFGDGYILHSLERRVRLPIGTSTTTQYKIPGLAFGDFITNLSVLNTPSGDYLLAVTGKGKFAVLDFNDATNRFTTLYCNNTVSFKGASNFKTAALSRHNNTFSLYFTTPSLLKQNPPTAVMYIPLTIDNDNQVDWSRLKTTSPIFHIMSSPRPSPGFPFQVLIPGNLKPTQISNTNAKCVGALKAMVMQVDGDRLDYQASRTGNSDIGAYTSAGYLWYNPNIQFQQKNTATTPRYLRDNLIGVVYGPPPVPAIQGLNNSVTFSYKLTKTQADSSSIGFSIDTSLKAGFTYKSESPLHSFEMKAMFGIFSSYQESLEKIKTITINSEKAFSSTTDDNSIWGNNTGYLIILTGFSAYDMYQLRPDSQNTNLKLRDANNKEILLGTVIPSSQGGTSMYIDSVSFKLSSSGDPIIKGSIQDTDHPRDNANDWTDYTKNMKSPGCTGLINVANLSQSYWGSQSQRGSAADINNAFTQNRVKVIRSDYLPVNNTGSFGSSNLVSFERKFSEILSSSSTIGITLDVEISGSGISFGGAAEFNLKAGMNWGSTSSVDDGTGFEASAYCAKKDPQETQGINDIMVLLFPTGATNNKPFWCPDWAWAKGNRPWCVTWQVANSATRTP